MFRRAIEIISALLATAIVAMQPSLVLANHTADCSEYGYVHRWMGYLSDTWADHRYAVKADLAQKVLARCTNPRAGEGSTSVVWVAIQGPPSNAGNIVQIGYGTCYPTLGAGNCPGTLSNHDFYAYGRDPNTPGCAGTSAIYPTGHWLSSFDGGPYSVE